MEGGVPPFPPTWKKAAISSTAPQGRGHGGSWLDLLAEARHLAVQSPAFWSRLLPTGSAVEGVRCTLPPQRWLSLPATHSGAAGKVPDFMSLMQTS